MIKKLNATLNLESNKDYKEEITLESLIKVLAKEAIKEMIEDDEIKIQEQSFNNRKKIYLSAMDKVTQKWKSNKSHYVVVDEVKK